MSKTYSVRQSKRLKNRSSESISITVVTCMIYWLLRIIVIFTSRLNRDAKQNLEMDWSDKKEAHEIDTNCFNLRNGHTNKQFHPGAARYQEIQSTPESWAQVCHQ